MSTARAGTPGATRVCPHCKAVVLERAAVCPGCRHHLRFNATDAQFAAAEAYSAFNIEGTIAHKQAGEHCEYCIVLDIRNERGEQILRQVVGVGALHPGELRRLNLAVEMLPVRAAVPRTEQPAARDPRPSAPAPAAASPAPAAVRAAAPTPSPPPASSAPAPASSSPSRAATSAAPALASAAAAGKPVAATSPAPGSPAAGKTPMPAPLAPAGRPSKEAAVQESLPLSERLRIFRKP